MQAMERFHSSPFPSYQLLLFGCLSYALKKNVFTNVIFLPILYCFIDDKEFDAAAAMCTMSTPRELRAIEREFQFCVYLALDFSKGVFH